MTRFLFVCTGNICRSPTAEGVFQHLAARAGLTDAIVADSVGIEGWHVGDPPDSRSIEAAARRGIDLSFLRARHLSPQDFVEFDLLLAMDRGHFRELGALAPDGHAEKIRMFMEAARGGDAPNVPDPYYGGASGFEDVLDMIEEGARAWLETLETREP
jgi:protein-tyrosine phosphatase